MTNSNLTAVGAALLISSAVFAAPPNAGHTYVDFPAEGVLLGQGWNSFKNTPATDVCVLFAKEKQKGHEISIDYKNIKNRLELNKSLNISVSGSYKGASAKVSAKADYSNSLNIDNRHTNIMAAVNVWKNDTFTAPYTTTPDTTPNKQYRPVELTSEAASLLTNGKLQEFRARCGDSFVSNVREGATLNAFLQYANLSREVKSSLSASMEASGWGATLNASAEVKEAVKNTNTSTKIQIFQTAGPLQPVPVDTENFNTTVQNFLKVESGAEYPTKPFLVGIQNYKKLHNWTTSLGEGSKEDLLELITLFWLYDDLRHTYVDTLNNNNLYLMNDSSQWKDGNPIFTFIEGGLCMYTYDEPNEQWTSKEPSCASHIEEKINNNLWSLNSVLENLQKLTLTTTFLKKAIDSCSVDSDGDKNYLNCSTDAALLQTAKKFAEFHEERKPKNNVAVAFGYDQLERDIIENKKPTVKRDDVWKIVEDVLFNARGSNILSSDNLLSGIGNKNYDAFFDHQKAALKACSDKKKNVQCSKLIKESADIAKKSVGDSFEKFVRDYYKLSFMLPVQARESKSDGALSILKEYLFSYSSDPATMMNNSIKVPKAIRANKMYEHISLSEGFCSEQITSRFCLSIDDLRTIADEASLNPVFTHSTAQFYQKVGERQSCHRPWPWRSKSCRNIAVMGYVTHYMSEFAADDVDL